jgi:hypothetical protein
MLEPRVMESDRRGIAYASIADLCNGLFIEIRRKYLGSEIETYLYQFVKVLLQAFHRLCNDQDLVSYVEHSGKVDCAKRPH